MDVKFQKKIEDYNSTDDGMNSGFNDSLVLYIKSKLCFRLVYIL